MFVAVTGFTVGKNSTELMKMTHVTATALTGLLQRPSVYGPAWKTTRSSYQRWATMTAMYDMSSAGAVMLKMAVMVSVEPIPIRSRQLQKTTTNHTALTGVCVYVLILDQKLHQSVSIRMETWSTGAAGEYSRKAARHTSRMGMPRLVRMPTPFSRLLAWHCNR
jgi:hypothetical protein